MYHSRSGGSSGSPDRAHGVDEVLSFVLFLGWSLLPSGTMVSAAITSWFSLSLWPLIGALVLLCGIFAATLKRQVWWLRGVHLRRRAPAKFRQIGIVNRVGQTPPIQRVRWRGSVVTLRCATGKGHPLALFQTNAAGLAAVLGVESVTFNQAPASVLITAVRRSAHADERPQSW